MKTIEDNDLDDFYEQISAAIGVPITEILPPGIGTEIGHFNVFDIADTMRHVKQHKTMPYNRRSYYKISLIRGRNRAEYADKVIEIQDNALLFATPKVPYRWVALDENQSGSFCVFTDSFLVKTKSGVVLDDLPLFRSGGYPIFQIDNTLAEEIGAVFAKMRSEISSDYEYKYDLLRGYVLELIHYGQKLQPVPPASVHKDASARIIALFIELLERQFPIDSPHNQLKLRSAKDYADRLAIHVNHLNKVLKDQTGQTTTEFINRRIVLEAKILIKQTDWKISEIAHSLGFEESAHFSSFFKKQVSVSPQQFRAA